jgi:hypothetical protein
MLKKRQPSSFFLTFSTEDFMKILIEGDRELVETYFEVKNEAMKTLRNIVLKNPSNEFILTEIALNIELQKMLKRSNIDKISFTVLKVILEGQIYKIYEQVPLTILSESPFSRMASKFFRRSGELVDYLHWLFSSPESAILNDIADAGNPVYSNLIKAVNAIYRFVTLGNTQGWFEFMRELYNAHEKVKSEKGESKYINIIRKIGVYI